jgi:hypothetical protein
VGIYFNFFQLPSSEVNFMNISRLKRVSLREIWSSEEKDFTPWLENNLDILGEDLGVELSVVEREKRAGTFEVDLLAEDSDHNPVIIENQFGKSDHDHLGKTITYLTQLNAKTVIWICEDPRPEHVTAFTWLNETTPDDIAFYMVKLEAFRIENSPPAPKFVVLSRPSSIMKAIGAGKREFAKRHKQRLEFWKGLLEKSKAKTDRFVNIKPSKECWIGTSARAGMAGLYYNYVILMTSSRVELYIDTGDKDKNKRIFDQLYSAREEIERKVGAKIEWQRLEEKRACRIAVLVSKRIGLKDEDKWDRIQEDMVATMIRFESALESSLQNLPS